MCEIADIEIYLPEKILSNSDLEKIFKDWSKEKIYEKTGILERRIVSNNETAADLGYKAANKLLNKRNIRNKVDFLIFCTQAPDYILPTSACILQERLNLPTSCGAFDINLGCSGYVYGLSIANALIKSNLANNVLLITSDTYSKYINEKDKSVRTLFGDAASASLIVRSSGASEMTNFDFGTDGKGAQNLIVPSGLFRIPRTKKTSEIYTDISGNERSSDNLYMNGPEILSFTLREVPKSIHKVMNSANWEYKDIDLFLLHQANTFLLKTLAKKMRISPEKLPIYLEKVGNTVSSSIPILMSKLYKSGRLERGNKLILSGFGVGYSWASCSLIF